MEITNKNTNNNLDVSNLVTVANLAKEWEVSKSTVYYWLKQGQIQEVEYLGLRFVDKSTFDPKISKPMLEVIIANYSKTA